MPYRVQDPVGMSSSAARPVERVIFRITDSQSADQLAGRPCLRKIARAGEGIGPPLPQDLCRYPSRIWICALRARALRPTYPPFLFGRSVNQTDHPPISHIPYPISYLLIRAGEGIRTLDINLGKVALYQLSYARDLGKLSSPRRTESTLFPGVNLHPFPHPLRSGLVNPHPRSPGSL